MRPHDNPTPASSLQRTTSNNTKAKEAKMDQTTLNFIAGGVMSALGWFARMLWDRQESQNKDLADFKIMVAREYVPNSVLGAVMSELKDDLRYIRDRLDETPQRRHGDRG